MRPRIANLDAEPVVRTTLGAAGRIAGASLLIALLGTGCRSVEIESVEGPSRGMSIEGLEIADGLSDTTRDVIAMLDIDAACMRSGPACADLVLTQLGTVREATRSVAAADDWYRYASRADQSDAFPAWLGCALETHRYLFAPTLAGRPGALEGRSQLALRLLTTPALPGCCTRWSCGSRGRRSACAGTSTGCTFRARPSNASSWRSA